MQLKHTWLPASTPEPPRISLQIVAAQGSQLFTQNQQVIYDAISSWWCKPLGHGHPVITQAISAQLEHFEHHIPANAWNSTIEQLSTRLVKLFSHMDKVIYASDGSSAVEIAMKLSYESRVLQQQPQRSKFIALDGAYHGETIFTLGVCGLAGYTKNYQHLIENNYFINEIPYVSGRHDPLWLDCAFNRQHWEEFFQQYAQVSSALIIEPVVQGAAGMKIISRDFLCKIIQLAQDYDLHIIADEIMVGLGRLGCYSVSKELLGCEADLVCFAKNLTAGSIPMSAVVVSQSISQIYRQAKQIFPHSHTHSCNTLAAAAANAYLDYLDSSDLLEQVNRSEIELSRLAAKLAERFSWIRKGRAIGAIMALECELPSVLLEKVFELALEEQLYLRPIGHTIYVLPPLYNLAIELDLISTRLWRLCERLTTMAHKTP